MCIAVPSRIVSIDNSYGIVSTMGVESKVNIELIGSPVVGDYVLIHSGFAIQKIDHSYFNYLEEIFTILLEDEYHE